MLIQDLNINPLIIAAIEGKNYKQLTAIQEKAIPLLLQGKDIIGCADTGTGKTAAFAIPILERLSKKKASQDVYQKIKAVILAPTRELAIQIGESFQVYGKNLEITVGIIYGGITPKRHIKVLKREPGILVATPGRLLDLFGQGYVDFSEVEVLVLDEADRMLDLGMIQDVKSIIEKLPKKRQTMLFSATIPKEISKLIQSFLSNPIKVEVKHKKTEKQKIQQKVYFVEEPDKMSLLLLLLEEPSLSSVLIFTRTKQKADKVSAAINRINIRTKAIHGDKNQSERLKALELFKQKEIRILVATDVAARGLDITQLSHVINMDVPSIPENYIHRIGRTGRADANGISMTFCSNQEIPQLRAIEKLQGKHLEVIDQHPFVPLNISLKRNREIWGK